MSTLAWGLAGAARAGQIEGVAFPPSHRVGSAQLELRGLGLLRYRLVFKGYVAALYLGSGVPVGSALADVEPGDGYALTYVPGLGTELALNGVSRGIVQGSDFSAALFSIWLGEQPFDASLKQQLLSAR